MKEAGEVLPPATIKAYPNPTNGNLNLELKGFAEGKARISLFCSDGSLSMQKDLMLTGDEQVVTLDLSELSAGMYIVQVVNDNVKINTTVIKH